MTQITPIGVKGTIRGIATLTGRIMGMPSIRGTIEAGGIVSYDYPAYEGETVITPKVGEATVLETKQHVLRENVTVLEIPDYETSNLYGTTFIIG